MSKKHRRKSRRDFKAAPPAPNAAASRSAPPPPPVAPRREAPPENRPTSIGQWVEVFFAICIIGGGVLWLLHTQAQRVRAAHAVTAATTHSRRLPPSRAAPPRALPVAVATARKSDMPTMVQVRGTVTPLARVTVRPQVAGRLTQISFKEGQTVKKGDALALINPHRYQAALAQYQAQLKHDAAVLKQAERLSRRHRDAQRARVVQYKSTVALDKAKIQRAKLNIADCHITAPIGGRLGLQRVDAGNEVAPEMKAGIVTITQMQPTSVVFGLPEDNLPAVRHALQSGAKITVTAAVPGAAPASGMLQALDNSIDPETGTLKARATFDNKKALLFPGQTVAVGFSLKTMRSVVTVPAAAVRRDGTGAFVYAVGPDDAVTAMPVKTGPTVQGKTVIAAGLSAGATVVTASARPLRNGTRVTITHKTNNNGTE